MENTEEENEVDLSATPLIYSMDSDDERQNCPQYRYMQDMLYDAKRWKKAGQVEYEDRVLTTLLDFLQEYLDSHH